jgi:hypothetical protein
MAALSVLNPPTAPTAIWPNLIGRRGRSLLTRACLTTSAGKLKQAAECFEHVNRPQQKRELPAGEPRVHVLHQALSTAAVILDPARDEEKHVGEQPTLSAGEAAAQRPVPARGARKRVNTTQREPSTQVQIGVRKMSRAPDHVARQIASQCPVSARRLQLARPRDRVGCGCSPAVTASLQLATAERLARADDRARGEDDDPPQTRGSSV